MSGRADTAERRSASDQQAVPRPLTAVEALAKLESEWQHWETIQPLQATTASVFRMEPTREPGVSIIAKRCLRGAASLERCVYEQILPQMAGTYVRYIGFVEEKGSEYAWIFIEDARGEPYSPTNEVHRTLAGTWLGRLHAEGTLVAQPLTLPVRAAEPYELYIRVCEDALRRDMRGPSMAQGAGQTLNALVQQIALVHARWSELEELADRLPTVLLHGDFLPSNIAIRDADGERVILPFDWALAGMGSPLIDLAQCPQPSQDFAGNPSMDAYWRAVRDHWPDVTFHDCCRAATTATVLQCLSAVYRDSTWGGKLEGPRSVANMAYYAATFQQAFRLLGWE